MGNTRTKNVSLSIVSGLLQRLMSIVIGLLSQWAFVKYLGFEYSGIDGLFSSVFIYLSLAELGVGNAIVVHLYKPLYENNKEEVKSLARFFKKSYFIIGIIMFTLGICLIPFLDNIVNFDQQQDINIQLIYILLLFNTCIPYLFFVYKSYIVIADQKSYIVNLVGAIFEMLISATKFIIIFISKNYIASLFGEIIIRLLYYFTLSGVVDRMYPYLREQNVRQLDKTVTCKILKDVKSLFVISVSYRMIYVSNDLIISSTIGTIYIGYLYMYSKIISHVTTIINMLTTSYDGSVANLVNTDDIDRQMNVYEEISLVNYWASGFSSVCLYSLMTPFLSLFYGNSPELLPSLLDLKTLFCLVIHFYISLTNNTYKTFRNAYGLISQGWLISLVCGFFHILMCTFMCKRYGLFGVYLAIIISDVLSGLIPNMVILFKLGFRKSFVAELFRFVYRTMILILIMLFINCLLVNISIKNNVISFIVKMVLCVLLPNVIFFALFKKTVYFKRIVMRIKNLLNSK